MGPSGIISQLSISPGGVPKLAIAEARVSTLGLEGDGHAHPDIHRTERAVCLYSLDLIEALVAEGHPIGPGSTGENVTVQGIDWPLIVPGARLRLGDAVELEITRYTTPCTNIRASFAGGDSNRIHHNLHPGWSRAYARVLAPGHLRTGDSVSVIA